MPHTLEVSHEFCAAHSISVSGTAEPVHGHNFRVLATVAGERLDQDGLLADFHTIHRVLLEVCRPMENRELNTVEPFHRLNPTAENIARHIADAMAQRLDPHLAPHARVQAVSVTEAPGCRAIYTRPA